MHLGLMSAGLLMPRVVNMRAHLAGLPAFIRQLFWVYYTFIALCLVSFSVITIVVRRDAGVGQHTGARLVRLLRRCSGRCGCSSRRSSSTCGPYLTSSARRVGYHALNVVFVYLPVVYALAASQPGFAVSF